MAIAGSGDHVVTNPTTTEATGDGAVAVTGEGARIVTNPTTNNSTTDSPTTAIDGGGCTAYGATSWQGGSTGSAVVEGNVDGGAATSGSIENVYTPGKIPDQGDNCVVTGNTSWQGGSTGAAVVAGNTTGGAATSGSITNSDRHGIG